MVGEGVREVRGGGVLRGGVDVDNQEVFFELLASGEDVPEGEKTQLPPSNTNSS